MVLAAMLLGAGCLTQAETPGAKSASAAPAANDPAIMQAMSTELDRAMAELGAVAKPGSENPDPGHPKSVGPVALKPYFLSYSVADAENVSISAQYGAIMNSTAAHSSDGRHACCPTPASPASPAHPPSASALPWSS